MDGRAADDLRELARRDAELAADGARLRDLDAQVAAVRARAEAIDAFFATYTVEEERRRESASSAAVELERRRAELADAERQLEAARDDEERDRAQQAVHRARDHVAVAEASLERAAAAAAELERDASTLPGEVPLLEARAREVANADGDVPEAPSGVRELVEWASHAHAELFVAARQLDAQRERLIREANELAAALLGEPAFGATVAQLAERVRPLADE